MLETDRTPAVTTTALRALGGPIKEALRSLNFVAAEAYVRDVLVEINHESAWCYDTDRDLPHMAAYFATLHDTCARIRHENRALQRELARDLIDTIDNILREMSYLMPDLVEERAPDAHVGIDEVGLRGRRYEDLDLAPPAVEVFD